jgi:hypothetical protein
MKPHFEAVITEFKRKRAELDQLIASLTNYVRETGDSNQVAASPVVLVSTRKAVPDTTRRIRKFREGSSLKNLVADAVSKLPEPFNSDAVLASVPSIENRKQACNFLVHMAKDGMIERVGYGRYCRTRGRMGLKALQEQIHTEIKPQIEKMRRAEEPTV